jgi:hypothetical protein
VRTPKKERENDVPRLSKWDRARFVSLRVRVKMVKNADLSRIQYSPTRCVRCAGHLGPLISFLCKAVFATLFAPLTIRASCSRRLSHPFLLMLPLPHRTILRISGISRYTRARELISSVHKLDINILYSISVHRPLFRCQSTRVHGGPQRCRIICVVNSPLAPVFAGDGSRVHRLLYHRRCTLRVWFR